MASTEKDQIRLHGQIDWIRWLRHFQELARSKDLWGIFTGEETVIKEPNLVKYGLFINEDGDAITPDGAFDESAYAVYRINLKRYESYHRRTIEARALLSEHCDKAVWAVFRHAESPKKALNLLHVAFGGNYDMKRNVLKAEFDEARVQDGKVLDFVLELEELRQDMLDAGHQVLDSFMIEKILQRLPPVYDPVRLDYHNRVTPGQPWPLTKFKDLLLGFARISKLDRSEGNSSALLG